MELISADFWAEDSRITAKHFCSLGENILTKRRPDSRPAKGEARCNDKGAVSTRTRADGLLQDIDEQNCHKKYNKNNVIPDKVKVILFHLAISTAVRGYDFRVSPTGIQWNELPMGFYTVIAGGLWQVQSLPM
ncbi:MAG: hypothetical protein ACFHX7_03575 [Pseudomonadota bacterium]